MGDVLVYHNKACSTSRHALQAAAETGTAIQIRNYLDQPLDRAELLDLIAILADDPADLVRKDKYFATLGLAAGDYRTPEAVADLLAQHPRLMQRPVLVSADRSRAIIGRPKERADEFLAGAKTD